MAQRLRISSPTAISRVRFKPLPYHTTYTPVQIKTYTNKILRTNSIAAKCGGKYCGPQKQNQET